MKEARKHSGGRLSPPPRTTRSPVDERGPSLSGSTPRSNQHGLRPCRIPCGSLRVSADFHFEPPVIFRSPAIVVMSLDGSPRETPCSLPEHRVLALYAGSSRNRKHHRQRPPPPLTRIGAHDHAASPADTATPKGIDVNSHLPQGSQRLDGFWDRQSSQTATVHTPPGGPTKKLILLPRLAESKPKEATHGRRRQRLPSVADSTRGEKP